MAKQERMCKLKKELPKTLNTMLKLSLNPTHICEKCGRVSNNKDSLCEPQKIE